jgi:hypothetical protein
MFGKTLSRKWAIEQRYVNEGLCLRRSYRREVETGVLYAVCLFDGTDVGQELASGQWDDVFPLFRDMIRTARNVGPWEFKA